jgi:hypothetical protein
MLGFLLCVYHRGMFSGLELKTGSKHEFNALESRGLSGSSYQDESLGNDCKGTKSLRLTKPFSMINVCEIQRVIDDEVKGFEFAFPRT